MSVETINPNDEVSITVVDRPPERRRGKIAAQWQERLQYARENPGKWLRLASTREKGIPGNIVGAIRQGKYGNAGGGKFVAESHNEEGKNTLYICFVPDDDVLLENTF